MRQVKNLIIVFLLVLSVKSNAQLGIGTTTPAASAQLDVTSTTKGMLVPRMTAAQRIAITSPVQGLLVYQTDAPEGFWSFNGLVWAALGSEKTATYRYASFHTYHENFGWAFGNDASLFGGVNPSTWTDGNGQASQMSSDKEVLRTLFTHKGYAKNNAMMFSETYTNLSSTDGLVYIALFRIKNTSGSTINWTPTFSYTAYSGWSEMASVALNGVSVMFAGSPSSTTLSLPIPANRVSSVIFVSTACSPYSVGYSVYLRNTRLAFYNNSLLLPAGLEFIDDLDVATGDWTQ